MRKTREEIMNVVDEVASYDEAYDAGAQDGYDEGYADGERDALSERDESMGATLERAAINPLEPFVGRWDAALKAWILSQDGREMIVRKEV